MQLEDLEASAQCRRSSSEEREALPRRSRRSSRFGRRTTNWCGRSSMVSLEAHLWHVDMFRESAFVMYMFPYVSVFHFFWVVSTVAPCFTLRSGTPRHSPCHALCRCCWWRTVGGGDSEFTVQSLPYGECLLHKSPSLRGPLRTTISPAP